MAKTYLYFKAFGLPQKTVDDIMLQVHGDMRRFEEARTLMLRLAHRSFDESNAAPTLHYGETAENETEFDGSWSNVSDYWTEKDGVHIAKKHSTCFILSWLKTFILKGHRQGADLEPSIRKAPKSDA